MRLYANARFKGVVKDDEVDLIANYFYQVTADEASGEFSANAILTTVSWIF